MSEIRIKITSKIEREQESNEDGELAALKTHTHNITKTCDMRVGKLKAEQVRS